MNSLAAGAGFKKRPRPEIPPVDGRRNPAFGIRIKDEPTDDIKDYAETTMNELLGWYGYDKVDSRDTQGLNLTHFRGTSNSPDHCGPGSGSDDAGSSSREGAACGSEGGGPVGSLTGTGSRPPTAGPTTPNGPPSTSPNPTGEEGTGSPEDTTGLPSGCIVCAWCQKVGMKLFTLKTSNGSKAFCSELCFTQCRRASFKKNKVCDWCKHVRHTVNYVDFQVEVCNDGDQQLQFCSDKCLNQYKMNIFCRETQAHLQMHPHLQEAANKISGASGGGVGGSSGALNLITPELWLRECKGSTNGHSNDGSDEREETLPENLSVNSTELTPSARKSVSPSSLSVVPNLRVETDLHVQAQLPIPKPRSHHRDKERSRRLKSGFRHKERRDHHARTGSSSSQLRTSARSPSSTCSTPLSNSSVNSHNHLANGPTPSVNGLGLMKQDHSSGGPPPSLNIPGLPPPLGPPFSGMGDGLRSPFLPPNMLPNHLNILAQQQMETLLRLQHNLGLRPGIPPMPLPSGMFPPLSHFPGAPGPRTMSPPSSANPPPTLPPPMPPRLPQQHHSSHGSSNHHHHKPSQHHHEHSSKSSKSREHHSSSREGRSSITPSSSVNNHASNNNNNHPTTTTTTTTSSSSANNSGSQPIGQSLLPPVTVMVPYPLLVPIPIPIPLIFPVPKDFVEKMSKQKDKVKESSADNETAVNLSNGGSADKASKESGGKTSPKCNSRNSSPRSSSKRVESVITKLVNSKRDKKERSTPPVDSRDVSPLPPPLLPVYGRSSTSVLDLEDSTEDAESSTPLPDGFSSVDDNSLSDDSDLGRDDDPLLDEGRTFDSYKVKLKEGNLTASLVRETISPRKRSPDKVTDLNNDSLKRKCV